MCAAKIAHTRQEEIARAITVWQTPTHNGHLVFLTLTMRHHFKDKLEPMWDALSYAWKSTCSTKMWSREKEKYGVTGFIRNVELMVKPSEKLGWASTDEHLHTHVLLFVDRRLTDDEISEWKTSIFGRWSRALARKGYDSLPIGQDLKRIEGNGVNFSEYLAKIADTGTAVGLELTHGGQKTGRLLGSVTPWGVLDAAIEGDADALAWWNSYEETQRGRRRLLWSYGLREFLLGEEREKTEEEIVAEEQGTDSDTLLLISAENWTALAKVPWRITALLDTTEAEGEPGARRLLERWHIPYLMPGEIS